MKTLISLLLVLTVSCSTNEVKLQQHDRSFILSNVNIVDVENQTILPAKTLVIQNGKIDSINDDLPPLTTAKLKVIDGGGGYITPGLIDMHVHTYEKAAYILTLSHGVTHVRVMNGVPKQLLWRDNIASGLQLGSTSSVSSPIISGNKGTFLHRGVATVAEAKSAVREYHSLGYDLIKAYGSLNQVTLSAIVEESHRLGIPLAKHGPHASGDMPISQLTEIQSFEHVEDIYQGPLNYEFAPKRLPEILTKLKATNVPVTPTLNIYYQLTKLSMEKEDYLSTTSKHYTSDIIAFEASNNQVERWLQASNKMAEHNDKTFKFLQHITKQMHNNNIPLLVGSDSGVLLSPHGIATHTEMRLLEESGINAFDVLTAATLTPAKALNLDNEIGKISVNHKADFIFSLSNPIQNLSILKDPEAVIKNGHWHTKESLRLMREQAIQTRSIWEELGVLFEAI